VLVEETLLVASVSPLLPEQVLAVVVGIPLVETALLAKFGLGTESNGLFCKP
jgi:hypothetical protein